MGVYIPPSEDNLTTVKLLDKALAGVNNEKVIVLGDLNVNMETPRDHRQDKIVNALKTFDLRDVAMQFKSREKRKKYFSWTWRKQREGTKIQSKVDYILGGNRIKWKRYGMIDIECYMFLRNATKCFKVLRHVMKFLAILRVLRSAIGW